MTPVPVIASEAKQSSATRVIASEAKQSLGDCFVAVLLAMTPAPVIASGAKHFLEIASSLCSSQ
jgi:hypothetical protein